MHEFGIAKDIMDSALAEAARHKGRHVRSIGVKLSRKSDITADSLEFCLKVAAKGTIAEEAKFDIKPLEPVFKCSDCGNVFTPAESGKPTCPACGGIGAETPDSLGIYLDSLLVSET
jgi:hydrogenase nickel incorporation protein HypA/HybF